MHDVFLNNSHLNVNVWANGHKLLQAIKNAEVICPDVKAVCQCCHVVERIHQPQRVVMLVGQSREEG